MAGGVEVATGYVTLYPRMSSDFKTSVETMTATTATSSSSKFSSKFSKGLSTAGLVAGNLITGALSTAVSAVASSIDSAVSRVDTLNQFPKVMSNLGFSTEEADASLSKLSDGIQGLPTALDEIVGNTQTLSLTLGDLNKGTDVALALNDGMLTYGASASSVSNAVFQLNQMISAGSYDLASWRSVIESAPGYMDQVAESCLGAGASANDLREALNGGTVTTDQFLDAIVTLDQEGSDSVVAFAEQAKTATGGIATSFTNVQTAITKNLANFIDEMNGDEGNIAKIADSLKGVINDIGGALLPLGTIAGEGIGAIAENFDGAWDSLKEWGSNIWSQVEEPVSKAFQAISDAGADVDLSFVADALGRVADFLSENFVKSIETVCGFVENLAEAFDNVQVFAADAGEAIGEFNGWLSELTGLDFQGSDVLGGVLDFLDGVASAVRTVVTALGGAIKAISQLLAGDFAGAWETARQTVDSFTTDMTDSIQTMTGEATYDLMGLDWDTFTQGFATSSEYVQALSSNVETMTGRCEAFRAAAASIDTMNIIGLQYELEQAGFSADEARGFISQFNQAVKDGGQTIIELDPSKITELDSAVSNLSGENVSYLAEALGYVVQSTDSANSGLSSMSYSAEQVAAAAANASETVSAAAGSMASSAASAEQLAAGSESAAGSLDSAGGSAQSAAATISSAMATSQESVSLTADQFAALMQGGTDLDGAMVQLYNDSGTAASGLAVIGSGADQTAGQFSTMQSAIDNATGAISALLQYNGRTVTINVVTAYSTTGTPTTASASANVSTSVSYFATGGVTNGVNVIGEAGPEAIVPLYAGAMDPFAAQVADFIEKESGGGTVYNVFVNDARVNDDAAIRGHVIDLFSDLDRLGAI